MVMVTGVAVEVFVIVTLLFGLTSSFAQTNMTTNTTTIYATAVNANPLVYHLSSSDPWRASIALTDASFTQYRRSSARSRESASSFRS